MAIDLKNILNYVAPAPTYLGKLEEVGQITSNDLDQLRNQSLVRGLLTAGLGYLAQPKNQRYGSAAPYLGKAGLMGLQAMDQPYQDYMKGFEFSTKIDKAQREKEKLKQRADIVQKLEASGEYNPTQMAAIKLATDDALLELVKQGKVDKPKLAEEYADLLTRKTTDPNFNTTDQARLNSLEKVVKLQSPTGGALQQSPYGTPPSGYTWKRDAAGNVMVNQETGGVIAVPIEGTTEFEKLTQEKEKKTASEKNIASISETVFLDGQRAIDLIKANPKLSTGPVGYYTQDVGYGPAFDLKKMIGSVKSNIGIDKLIEIKKSGAGLGQIPQTQLETLQSVLGGLEQGQNTETLIYNLERVMQLYGEIVKDVGGPEQFEVMLEKAKETPERKRLEKETGFNVGQTITTKSGRKARWNGSEFEYID
jgi:hypothetical protein